MAVSDANRDICSPTSPSRQGRIYERAKGARAQGGKFPGVAYEKKSRLKCGMRKKKAVHEREIWGRSILKTL
jgi:hypothetical protein